VAIPDNTGALAVAQATFGKVGVAMTLEVKITLQNTDLSTVRIVLLPPDDKKVGYLVCDPCGDKDAKDYNVTLTEKSSLKSGTLADSLGKSLEGSWTLQVLDSSYCLAQVPANVGICNVGSKSDGAISAHSTVLSSITPRCRHSSSTSADAARPRNRSTTLAPASTAMVSPSLQSLAPSVVT